MLEVTASEISYSKPSDLRSASGFVGLILGVVSLSLLCLIWPSPDFLAGRSPADLGQMIAVLLVPLIGLCGPTALFLHMAGPDELIINTVQRTYRFRRGFPLVASWQSGPLDDIAGLRVKTQGNSITRYGLLLDWKNTQAAQWTLGDGAVASRRPFLMMSSRDAGRMREEAQRLASVLGVPVKGTTPVWDEVRRRAVFRLCLVPAVLFFALMGLSPLLIAQALESDGQATQGTVTALRYGKGQSIRYAYHVGTRVFNDTASVPASAYSLELGGPVSVRYLPTYPHTSTVVGARDAEGSGLMLAAAAFFMLLLILS